MRRLLIILLGFALSPSAHAVLVFSCTNEDQTLLVSGRQEDNGTVAFLSASVHPSIAKSATKASGRYSVELKQGDSETVLSAARVTRSGRHSFDGTNYQDDAIVLDFRGADGRLEAQIGGDLYLSDVTCQLGLPTQ